MAKWNKKGLLDDWFDFLFTILVCFFLLLFIGVFIDGAAKAKKVETLKNLDHTMIVEDYLINQREALRQEESFSEETLDKEITSLRKTGRAKPEEIPSFKKSFGD